MAGLAAAFNGLRTIMDRRSTLDGVARGSGATRATAFVATRQITPQGLAWIPERSATRLREADLNVLSKLGKQGLEWRLEPEAFPGREVGGEDDLLDVLVGYAVDIEVARQPSA